MLTHKNATSILINLRDETELSETDITLLNYLIEKEKSKVTHKNFTEENFNRWMFIHLVQDVVAEILESIPQNQLAWAMRTQESKKETLEEWLSSGQLITYDETLMQLVSKNEDEFVNKVIDFLTKNYKTRKKIGLLSNSEIVSFLNDFGITFWRADEHGWPILENNVQIKKLLTTAREAKLKAQKGENKKYYLYTEIDTGKLEVSRTDEALRVVAKNRFGKERTVIEFSTEKPYDTMVEHVLPTVKAIRIAQKVLGV